MLKVTTAWPKLRVKLTILQHMCIHTTHTRSGSVFVEFKMRMILTESVLFLNYGHILGLIVPIGNIKVH